MSIGSLITTGKSQLISSRPDDFLDEAIALMVNSNRNAVAVNESPHHLSGILTDHDVIRAVHIRQNKALGIEREHVSDWMTAEVITCNVETKLTSALALMGRHKIRHLVVTDKNIPLAIVSIRDILSKIHEHDELEVNVLRDIAIASRAAAA